MTRAWSPRSSAGSSRTSALKNVLRASLRCQNRFSPMVRYLAFTSLPPSMYGNTRMLPAGSGRGSPSGPREYPRLRVERDEAGARLSHGSFQGGNAGRNAPTLGISHSAESAVRQSLQPCLQRLLGDNRMVEPPVRAQPPILHRPLAEPTPFRAVAHGETGEHPIIIRQRCRRDLMPGFRPEADQDVTKLRIVGRLKPGIRRKRAPHIERHVGEVA